MSEDHVDERVIEFTDALPGLPGMARCQLVELGDSGALFRLRRQERRRGAC